ncbi:MaoC family dehydratase N-terminal domain-containing protein [Variovorax paradoxus]|nr:MaoC/PaaZ C-terminal domain-containing protein [Variovorax paradoxus]MBT2301932.1 MaoC family dehydratase N-terminal domain-containing protein [Variovorax paradoxus]
MNLDHVVSRRFEPTEQDYHFRDSLLYALSLGMGSDPLDTDELPYVFEAMPGRPQQVVPSQAVILGWIPFWQDDPATGIDWQRILHGEERIRIHRPLRPGGRVRAHHRIVGVQDKGAGRGALLQMDTELVDRDSGERIASLESLQFMRGDGGCGDWGQLASPLPPMNDADTPCATREYATSLQSALLYRAASQDWMPVHADPAVAAAAGFDRPIAHGLNNMGRACRAILKSLAPGAPERLRYIAGRWVSPGLPGDTVRVDVFRCANTAAGGGTSCAATALRFCVTAVERNVRLIDRGICELAN